MRLSTLTDLKLVKTKSQDLVLTYRGESLCLIKTSILEKFIVDFTSEGRINALLKSNLVANEANESDVDKAIKLYFTRKKAFLKGRPLAITTIKKSSPDYQKFKLAVAIALNHGVSFAYFLKAQEEELKNINHGVGTYPSPSHLCTSNAENRLIEYIAKTKNQVSITDYDKNTKYKDNKKFQSIFQKVKNEEYSDLQLNDVNYLIRVIDAKDDKVPDEIVTARNAILARMEA
jgi:hypothetical protein